MKKFRSVYNRGDRSAALKFEGERGRSRAKQSFKGEADINNIMARYTRTGVLTDMPGSRRPYYGDFSDGADFAVVQDRIVKAQTFFESLPSDVRDFFRNSASKMLDFVADENNAAKCVELGLLSSAEAGRDSEPAQPAAPSEPSPAPSEVPAAEAAPAAAADAAAPSDQSVS